MNTKTVFLVAALMFTAAPSAPSVEVVPEHQIVTALTCLMSGECNARAETHALGSQTVRIMDVVDDRNYHYQYFLVEDGRFGVTALSPDGKLVVLIDADLDGKIESASQTTETGPAMAPIDESDPAYSWLQGIYVVTMGFIDQIAPQYLLEAAQSIPAA